MYRVPFKCCRVFDDPNVTEAAHGHRLRIARATDLLRFEDDVDGALSQAWLPWDDAGWCDGAGGAGDYERRILGVAKPRAPPAPVSAVFKMMCTEDGRADPPPAEKYT